MLTPAQHLMLRQAAMAWALETSIEGEESDAVLQRAEMYLNFVLYPMRPDVVAAMDERRAATSH